MKKRIFAGPAIFVVILAAFASADAGEADRVSVKVGETGRSRAGVRIKVIEVVEDSRCPVDTTCIWAGNAVVRVEFSGGRRTGKKVVLVNTGQEPSVVSYGGYTFRLTGLTPEPRSNIRIDPRGYRATFEVTRAAGK